MPLYVRLLECRIMIEIAGAVPSLPNALALLSNPAVDLMSIVYPIVAKTSGPSTDQAGE